MVHYDSRIFVAGAGGMVGRAVVDRLRSRGFTDLITPKRSELDLTEQNSMRQFFASARPDVVILAAAKVGGIMANNIQRAEFLYDNLMIEANVIDAAYREGVKKLLFLGSSCIYPRLATQPIKEEEFLKGPLEPSNEPYAIAKIAGIKLCESYFRQYGCDFYSLMPTNLYGPGDNFDEMTSHVIPALIRKFHDAKTTGSGEVTVWGTGKPRREFLYVSDLADAVLLLLEKVDADEVYGDGVSHINIGFGSDTSIADLAETVKRVVGFKGAIRFDNKGLDGAPRKLLDSSRILRMGWAPKVTLSDGLDLTYLWYKENVDSIRT